MYTGFGSWLWYITHYFGLKRLGRKYRVLTWTQVRFLEFFKIKTEMRRPFYLVKYWFARIFSPLMVLLEWALYGGMAYGVVRLWLFLWPGVQKIARAMGGPF
jgi:hypothetical protein